MSGIYVSCKFDSAGVVDLLNWAKDNLPDEIPLTKCEDIHSTIVYSDRRFPCEIGSQIRITHPQVVQIKGLKLLGRDEDEFACLALVIETPLLESFHKTMKNLGANHYFDDYVPHITLSYEVPKDFDLSTISAPTHVQLVPSLIQFEPLKTREQL